MTLWQYRIVEWATGHGPEAVEAELNKLALDGWEVQLFGLAGQRDPAFFLVRRATESSPDAPAGPPGRQREKSEMSWPGE